MTDGHTLTDEEKRVLWAVQFGVLRLDSHLTQDIKCWGIGDWCVDDIVQRLHRMRMITGDSSEWKWKLTPLGRSHL